MSPAPDITESIPTQFSGGGSEILSFFNIDAEAFDISIGSLPFLLHISEDTPYERISAQWRKEQFDNLAHVGEQSLVGWWLRSQISFNGGSGIEYFEPLQAPDILIESRFRDSHGVDVLRPDGEVRMLPEVVQITALASSTTDLVASGTRLLLLDGTTVKVWDGSTLNTVTMPGGSAATKLAYTGDRFLIGHATGIAELDADTGTTATALWTNAAAPVKPFWAKQRIFATEAQKVYELTLAGGDLSTETEIFEHPNTSWEWVAVTETGSAVWLAGGSAERSAVHSITIQDDGSLPALAGATVAIQFPDGEIVNALLGYLDFLLVATSRGFRVAFTQGAAASLGPLIFRDPAYAVAARGDFVWTGLDDGLTRKIDLGRAVGGDLAFAYANDLESPGTGQVAAFAFFDDKLTLAHAAVGVLAPGADLVAEGSLTTGFIRVGVAEDKYFESVRVNADVSFGAIALSTIITEDPVSQVSLANFIGSRDINLSLESERIGLQFRFTPDLIDPTKGPVFRGYQLRAMPMPARRQRLIQVPIRCYDRETDRWGLVKGGPRFAWARLNELERLEENGSPVVFRDFRTGSNRRCFIESVGFEGIESPSRENANFGGTGVVALRTVD